VTGRSTKAPLLLPAIEGVAVGPVTERPETERPQSVGALVRWVTGRLGSESEARWIVAHAVGDPAGAVFGAVEQPVSVAVADAVAEMTRRRRAGEPLQYVLGVWSFRELEVETDGRALVPRPETEQVVEVALGELARLRRGTGAAAPVPRPVVVDLGTGSGVIALSLAVEGPVGLEVWGTDVSADALALAQTNLERVSAGGRLSGTVQLVQGDWFAALPEKLAGGVHLLVSNPPYVSAGEWPALDPVVRHHEPRRALVSGPSGREALERLVDESRDWLAAGGSLVLELAPHQAGALAGRAEAAGYVEVGIRADLSGRERTLVARWPG